MFWFKKKANREDVEKSFRKVRSDFSDIKKENKALKEELNLKTSKKEVELLIKVSSLDLESRLMNKTGLNSEPLSEPIHRTKSRTKPKEKHFEAVILKKAKTLQPQAIKQAISSLMDKDLRTTDIFNALVNEKKMCGKTQFYHYLGLVRAGGLSANQTELRTKLRTKQE